MAESAAWSIGIKMVLLARYRSASCSLLIGAAARLTITTISSARTCVTARIARIRTPSAEGFIGGFARLMALKHEVQRQAPPVLLVADAHARLKVAECRGVIQGVDGDLLQLKLEVEVLGKIPARADGHRVLIPQRSQ